MAKRRKLDRNKLLAAEIYGYSYDNYQDHLGIGHVRFEELMPEGAKTLERAYAEEWPIRRIAEELEVDTDTASSLQAALVLAREVVDAANPAESFRNAVRQCIRRAADVGINDDKSIEKLAVQICYRAADLSFLLAMRGERLSRYSQELRSESGLQDLLDD